MEDTLQKIFDFAKDAHGDQMRKYAPDPYIVHPVRVMETCKRVSNDTCILAAALLHDVLEDTAVRQDALRNFLLTVMSEPMADRTLQLVIDLTDVYVKKNYPELNRRTRKSKELVRLEKTSADSQTIKYADIIDNAKEIVTHDADFAKVYLYECRTNLRKLHKGNPDLYNEALHTVEEGIKSLDNEQSSYWKPPQQ